MIQQKKQWDIPQLITYDHVAKVTGQNVEKCGSNVDDWQPVPQVTLLGVFRPDHECEVIN